MQKILIILLIPLLIFASGGLNIFSHYCHSDEAGKISIVSSPDCDHAKHSCCDQHEDQHCESESSDAPCCESKHSFIKTVERSFLENPVQLGKLVFAIQTLNFSILALPDNDKYIPLGYRYMDYSSPPDYSPKYISVFQQKLRIDC